MKYKFTMFRKNENFIWDKDYNKKLNKSFDRFGDVKIKNNINKWQKDKKLKELKQNYKFFYDKTKVNLKEYESENFRNYRKYMNINNNFKLNNFTIPKSEDNILENIYNILYNKYTKEKIKYSNVKEFFLNESKILLENFKINSLNFDMNKNFSNFKNYIEKHNFKNKYLNNKLYKDIKFSKYNIEGYYYLIDKINAKNKKIKQTNKELNSIYKKLICHRSNMVFLKAEINNMYHNSWNFTKRKFAFSKKISFMKKDEINYEAEGYKVNEKFLNEKTIIQDLEESIKKQDKLIFYLNNKIKLIKVLLKKVVKNIVKLDPKLFKIGIIRILMQVISLKINIKKDIFINIWEPLAVDFIFRIVSLKINFYKLNNEKNNNKNKMKEIWIQINQSIKMENIRLKKLLNYQEYKNRQIYYNGSRGYDSIIISFNYLLKN